jgi:hypothetical protein
MLGDSAGRSQRNPTSPRARRRATHRERAAIEPPQDQLESIKRPSSVTLKNAVTAGTTIYLAASTVITFMTEEPKWILSGWMLVTLVLWWDFIYRTVK